jgi:hypothetical protein
MELDDLLTVNGGWLVVNGNGQCLMEMGERLMIIDGWPTVNGD